MEKWLISCESIMRETIKSVNRMCFDAYATTERIEWVVQWPGQAIICVDSMYWTMEMANAIKSMSLQSYADHCTEEIMKVVNKVGEIVWEEK